MDNLNESCFAFPALRKFPINTKESAISSFGAYKMQKNAFSQPQRDIIEENFKKAASFYEIELEDKPEEPEKRTVLMFKGASQSIDMHEILNLEELDKAVDFILEKRASMQRNCLSEPAKYVLWQASNADVDMDTPKMRKIAHIAGIGVGDRDEIEHAFMLRGTLNPLSDKDRDAFWKYAREMQGLSDDDFYKEATLNTICDTMDAIDFMYNNQHRQASEIGYPEDVVFKTTQDDLLKEASDLYYVKSVDATLSKKATLERKDAINTFFKDHFDNAEALDGEELINKVASLDAYTAEALLETVK